MPLNKPYKRIARPSFHLNNVSQYYNDDRFAPDSTDYIRAYELIEADLIQVFDHIEPADGNLKTYSHELYQLLLRASTEFESNSKAILRANNYTKTATLNITDYHKVERACRLSDFTVTFPVWRGAPKSFTPFSEWKASHSLGWYQAYNDVKHDRSSNFPSANLENALNAVSAVYAILFAQFYIVAFDAYHAVGFHNMDSQTATYSHQNRIARIQIPIKWPRADEYAFNWDQLSTQPDPFDIFRF